MEITKVPHAVLEKKAAPIPASEIKNGAYAALVSDMKRAMVEHNGVGLAANQLGRDLAIFVIEAKLAADSNVPEAYFNPEITEYSKDTDDMEEGCLSIPGQYLEIPRAKKVMLKAVDEHGNKIKIKARGFLARVYQHETDHLNGLTIKDRSRG